MCTENQKKQRQKRCLPETANTCTQKLRTRPCGVFAVFIVPYGYKGQMGLEEEASPDKWGRLHSLQLEESTGEQPQLKAEVRPGSAALSGMWHCATPTRPDRTGTPATTAPTTPTAPPRW